jgi:hypothetical protein
VLLVLSVGIKQSTSFLVLDLSAWSCQGWSCELCVPVYGVITEFEAVSLQLVIERSVLEQ